MSRDVVIAVTNGKLDPARGSKSSSTLSSIACDESGRWLSKVNS